MIKIINLLLFFSSFITDITQYLLAECPRVCASARVSECCVGQCRVCGIA